MPMPRKQEQEKYCAYCGKRMHRKKWANGRLESNLHFSRRKYCDRKCMAAAFDAKPMGEVVTTTTAHWHSRKLVPKGPCEMCGKTGKTDVHHKDGNWMNNDPKNLVRLCRSCHLKAHDRKGRCQVCGKPQKGLGYCSKHLQRYKKFGDPMMTAYGPRP